MIIQDIAMLAIIRSAWFLGIRISTCYHNGYSENTHIVNSIQILIEGQPRN